MDSMVVASTYGESKIRDMHIIECFRFDYKNARYVATHEDYQDFIAYSNNNMILGTHSWTLINDSKVSGENKIQL